jgi:Rrf2 family iron-responsive transcriptional regulator
MRLTQQTSYSIRALLYCTAHGDRPSRIRDIARTYGISELHLFKIMHVLVENGFVATIRGRNGGIRLARPADEITVGAVVRATEGNFHLTDCFDPENHDCPLTDSCGFNRVLRDALAAFFAVLDSWTIADLASNRGELRSLLAMESEMHPMLGAAMPSARPS